MHAFQNFWTKKTDLLTPFPYKLYEIPSDIYDFFFFKSESFTKVFQESF